MSKQYSHYSNITKEILDTVKVGDLIKINDWKKPMRVKAVSENYFVMTKKQQLEIKDRQIEQLQQELITERQHNRSQSDKLAVLATQAQTLQLAQLSEDKIKSDERTQKIHWWKKRKGVRNSGRKKNVCEVHN